MCLHLKDFGEEAKIAEENIVCYKSVFKNNATHFSSLYMHMHIKLGNHYVDSDPYHLEYTGGIDRGYYHTFETFEDAKKLSEGYNGTVLKAIIPKGTRYYKGICESRMHFVPGYASKEIKYIEEIPIKK